MESLLALKSDIAASKEILLANPISLGSSSYDPDTQTAFTAQDPEPWTAPLKTIVHAWTSRGKSLADYIAECEDLGIRNLKFAERADLLAWLEGRTDESEYIASSDSNNGATELYAQIAQGETQLSDHNSILQGSKCIDFTSASKECHKLIMGEFRKHQKFVSGTPSASSVSPAPRKQQKKEPIILLSPSPSSLINMSNIKEFLESGKFEPVTRSSSTSSFARLQRESPQLGKVRFFVVDNVERFKPEYWDRVVAVFVTGQPWQLKSYKWSEPNQLFSHALGISVNYKGDPLPPALKGWNVALEELERTKRFKDHEVVERIWERLESHMLARGWGKK